MKRIYTAIAIALCLALTPMLDISGAARPGGDPYVAAYEPDVAQTGAIPAATDGVTQKQLSLDVWLNGQPVRAELTFTLAVAPKNSDWTELTTRFTQAATASIQSGSGASAENLGQMIQSAVGAQIDAAAETLAGGKITLADVKVTLPFYEELKRGSSGEAVKRIQNRLIQLGFLEGTADGQFGGGTETAIESLETYIRQLEQAEIDANATPTPAPTPTPTVAPTPDPSATAPAVTAAPAVATATPEPAPTPETAVDGVVEPSLQAYLLSDDFPSAQTDLKRGDQGDAVLRFQRALSSLGVMVGTPDGVYGASTQRSVRLVQYANGLPENGIADVALQKLVFSGDAKALSTPLLQQGSSGDEVLKLQKRLHILGFLIGTPDGDFGAATETAIENLQTYFQAQERAELVKQALAANPTAVSSPTEQPAATTTAAPGKPKDGATVAPTATVSPTQAPVVTIDETLLTTVVNGVADPLLLNQFYDASFPDIPPAMQNGSAGEEVKRLQRRLYDMEYLFTSADGGYGSGTESALKDFQKRNGLTQTGVADMATLKLLFSDSAKKALKPYVLKVSIAKQRVYVYAPDGNEEYTKLVKTLKCSTGRDSTPTPKGTYQASTGPGARWHYFKKFDIWAQYAFYIQGDYMFHSVLYTSKNGSATSSSIGNLGRQASHGCVRLSVADAKWVYNNCPAKTKVIVY